MAGATRDPVPATRPATDGTEPSPTKRDELASAETLAASSQPAEAGAAATLAASGTAAGTDLQPPTTLPVRDEGRYDLREELGRGGMGRVSLAVDRSLGREVALKELLATASVGASVGDVARFVREARVTGRLEHPGIVPVHELGRRADGALYYTMKRIRGRSLATALETARSLGERLALLGHFKSVSDAVAYAHSRGVVHRDLKPANVMLGEFGETLVVDWGLAKVRGESDLRGGDARAGDAALDDAARTMDGAAIGTPAYMSPEQARGETDSIDERSDVWGLGAILFELLTGRPPFVGATGLAVLTQVLGGAPPRVEVLEPAAPPELRAIVNRALGARPDERYASARELAADVGAFLEGRTVGAYEYSAWEQLRRFVTRHRAASIASGAVLATVLAAGIAVGAYAIEADAARDRAVAAREETAAALEATEAQRVRASRSDVESRIALAEALLDRAERALSDREPGTAALWAAESMTRDPVHPANVDGAALSLLDQEAIARAESRRVRAISTYVAAEDVRTLVLVRTLAASYPGSAVSDDARWLARPAVGGLEIVDLTDGSVRTMVASGVDGALAVVDAGLVIARGGAPGVYDVESGERLLALPDVQHAGSAGGRVALRSTSGGLSVLAADTRSVLRRLPSEGDARRASPTEHNDTRFSWSSPGDRLAVLDGSHLRVFEWPDFERASETAVPVGAPDTLRLSPDGERVVFGLREPALLFGTRASVVRLDARGWTSTPAAWPDDDVIAVAEGEHYVVLRNGRTGAVQEALRVPESGSLIAMGATRLVRVPLGGADDEAPLPAAVFSRGVARRREIECGNGIQDFTLDAANDRLVVALTDRIVTLDLSGGRLAAAVDVTLEPSTEPTIASLAVSESGSLATLSTTGRLAWWDADGQRIAVAPGSDGRPTAAIGLVITRSGDEVLAAEITSGRVRRVARDGRELAPLEGHAGPVRDLVLSPDGALVASASDDGTVRVWALPSGDHVRTLGGHEGLAACVAFSPDGTQLATGDGVGTLRVFDVSTGEARCSIRAHDDWINRLAFSPDGEQVLTGSDDYSVRIVAADCTRVRRIVPTLSIGYRGFMIDGDLVFVDGRRVIRVPALPDELSWSPAALLDRAERNAGLRVDGLNLVARDAP